VRVACADDQEAGHIARCLERLVNVQQVLTARG